MKVVFCSEFFFPSVGGAQEVMRQLATRMAKAGHEVTVATSQLAERTSNEYGGVTIKPFSVSGNAVSGMAGEVDEYRKFLAESEFDVLFVYAAQQWTFDALWDVLPDLTMRKAVVPCGYSGLLNRDYQAYFERLPSILAQFDAIVYHARNYRDYEFGYEHGLENLAVLIPNGADDDEFLLAQATDFRQRMAIPQDALVLLTVGSLNGSKGHLELAQALEKLDFDEQPVVLLLNGNQAVSERRGGSFTERLGTGIDFLRVYGVVRAVKEIVKAVLSALGLRRMGYLKELSCCVSRINRMQDRQALVCDLNRHELIQAYFAADLFVLASNVEYSPLVLYEACAAGTPFLSVSVGNAAEIAEWTGGGEVLMVESDEDGLRRVSPEALAADIRRLLLDKTSRARLGASGRSAWLARFNWSRLANEYMQLFERICLEGKK